MKPSNLVLDELGRAVLVDLGALQKQNSGSAELATPQYLIPDRDLQSTIHRDLYAAALTFGALVTGRILDPTLETSLSKIDPLIPESCDEIMLRGLGIEERFRSTRQMLAVVQRLLPNHDPSHTTSPPTRRVRLPEARRKLVLWPFLFALLCYPLGLGAAHLFKEPPPGPRLGVSMRSGIDISEGSYNGKSLWRTSILGRPIAGFADSDPAAGNETHRPEPTGCQVFFRKPTFSNVL